jgi:hypothetical protein
MSTIHEGGCLCGAVRYRIVGDPIASTTCHCRTCRKATASALVPWLHLDATKLTYSAGKPAEFQSSPGVTRTFCGRCGTPLTYWTTSYGPRIDVTTASLDDPEAFPPMAHFWTSHKVGWLKLADELPTFEEGLPSE